MTPTPTSARRRTPAAARARLRRERPETVPVRPAPHGVRLARAAAWAAIAAGPCALALFLVVPRPSVAVAQPAPPVSNTVRPAAGPAGVAEVFTDLWLRGNQQNPEDSVGLALRTLAPTVELPRPGRSQAGAVRTVAVDTAPAKGGGWSVVVAALPESNEQGGPAVRYFAVPVAGESGRFVVTGAPGEVGAPAPGAVPQDVFRVPVPAGRPLEAALGEFFGTYLGGGAGLDRYLSPGIRMTAPVRSGYERVRVQEVAADSEAAAAGAVPADGSRARARVRVVGEDRAGGRWPLVYRVEVAARAGRWEVASLEAGTPAAPAALTAAGGAR